MGNRDRDGGLPSDLVRLVEAMARAAARIDHESETGLSNGCAMPFDAGGMGNR